MIDIAKMDREIAEGKALSARATRLVDRFIPITRKSFHGFYEPIEFFEKARVAGVRERLHYYLKAKLRAKRDGTVPRIGLPKSADHIFFAGEAMFDVAVFIEAQNARKEMT